VQKRLELRIDKFLNAVNIVKRRSIADEMCKEGVVFVNGKKAKPAKVVKVGDIIEIHYLSGVKKFEVLKMPEMKTIPKSKKSEYVREIEN
jgi:ribosomal 50S subunit-recycling heat shock protein